MQYLQKDVLVRPEQFDHPGIADAVDQGAEEADRKVGDQKDPEDEGERKEKGDDGEEQSDKAELYLSIPQVEGYCGCVWEWEIWFSKFF